ncbi:hypothetical protein KI387_015807, partial [Taxus chinensis]
SFGMSPMFSNPSEDHIMPKYKGSLANCTQKTKVNASTTNRLNCKVFLNDQAYTAHGPGSILRDPIRFLLPDALFKQVSAQGEDFTRDATINKPTPLSSYKAWNTAYTDCLIIETP